MKFNNEMQQDQNQQKEKDKRVKGTNNAVEENSNEDPKKDIGNEVEAMDIGDLHLDGIKQACGYVDIGYVTQDKVSIQESIQDPTRTTRGSMQRY